MAINLSGLGMAAISFILILGIWYAIDVKKNKSKISNYDKRLRKLEEDDDDDIYNPLVGEDETKNLNPIDKLELNLQEAEIKMGVIPFLIAIGVLAIILYLIALKLFGKPLIALAPLPFALYFVPNIIISTKKQKALDQLEKELVLVFRRMSSVLQSGSILQALDDVKKMENLSKKTKLMLYEIRHYIKYGDSIETAFYKATSKIKCENLQIAVITIDLNKEFGADLSKSLNNIAERIQKKQVSLAEANSLLSGVKVMSYILSIVPFLLLGYITYQSPGYFDGYLVSINNQIVFLCLISCIFLGIFVVTKKAGEKVV